MLSGTPNQSQRPGFFGRHTTGRKLKTAHHGTKPKPATGLLRSTHDPRCWETQLFPPNQSQRPGFFGRLLERYTSIWRTHGKPKPATGLLRSTQASRSRRHPRWRQTKASDRASSVDGRVYMSSARPQHQTKASGRASSVDYAYPSVLSAASMPNQSQRPGFFGRRQQRLCPGVRASRTLKPATGLVRSTQCAEWDVPNGMSRTALRKSKPATGLLRSTMR